MKKGVKKIVVGAVLFVAATLLPFALIIPVLFEKDTALFLAPGSVAVHVDKPGKYVLWNVHQTVYEGRSYSSGEALPDGVIMTLTNDASGQVVAMQEGGQVSSQAGATAKVSIGNFMIEQPGDYLLSVTGDFQPRVFSIGRSAFGGLGIVALLLGGLGSFVGTVAGFILLVVGTIQWLREPKQAAVTHTGGQ